MRYPKLLCYFLHLILLAISNATEICFEGLDCFPMDEPWRSPMRQIPDPMPPSEMNITLELYTRQNGMGSKEIIEAFPPEQYGSIVSTRPTVIIIHGYTGNPLLPWILNMLEAYMSQVDANFIVVNWEKASDWRSYMQTVSNTRVVGAIIAKYIQFLQEKIQLDLRAVHLIGHSAGGQLVSYIGKYFPDQKIGKLTALDPAQPAFEGFPSILRITKTDAEFVEVIHSDSRPFFPLFGFGYMAPAGDVDYYVNGGAFQPGCLFGLAATVTKLPHGISHILNGDSYYIQKSTFCSHFRAAFIYTAAVQNQGNQSCEIIAKKMFTPPKFMEAFNSEGYPDWDSPEVVQECEEEDSCILFGLNSHLYPGRGLYYIETTSKEPYCVPCNQEAEAETDMDNSGGLLMQAYRRIRARVLPLMGARTRKC